MKLTETGRQDRKRAAGSDRVMPIDRGRVGRRKAIPVASAHTKSRPIERNAMPIKDIAERSERAQGLTGSGPLFDNERAMISIDDLSKFMGVPRKTIYSWFYRGTMPQPYKIGQRVLFAREEIVAWLQSKRRGAE